MSESKDRAFLDDDRTGLLKTTKNKFMCLLITETGQGKTITAEGIAEAEKESQKYVVISITDEKRNWESCMRMFEPVAEYHLRELKKQRIIPRANKIKIYHPFSFNIPHSKLPLINFFTIPVKEIERAELNLLFETEGDTYEIQLFLDAIKALKKDEGLHQLVWDVSQQIKSDSDISTSKKIVKPKPPFFTSESNMAGTIGNIKDIKSRVKPYLNEYGERNIKGDYFLASKESPISLYIEKLFNDQEHEHCFVYNWLQDEKQYYFCILALLDLILRNATKSKYPILIRIEEMKSLCPKRAKGFKEVLAFFISKLLATARGLNVSVLSTTQAISEIHESLISLFKEQFLGQINAPPDVKVLQELKVSADSIRKLRTVKKGRFYYRPDIDDTDTPYVGRFPSGRHCEEGDNFLKIYEEHNKTDSTSYPMQDYKELIKQMKELHDKDMLQVQKKADEQYDETIRQIAERERIAKEKKENENKTNEELKQIQEKKELSKLEIGKRIYDLKKQKEMLGGSISWTKLAEVVFGKNSKGESDHKKAQRYCKMYEDSINSKDIADEVHEALGSSE